MTALDMRPPVPVSLPRATDDSEPSSPAAPVPARRGYTDWSRYQDLLGKIPDGRLAAELGVTRSAIAYQRRLRGIGPAQPCGRPEQPPRRCAWCSRLFVSTSTAALYCSPRCASQAHEHPTPVETFRPRPGLGARQQIEQRVAFLRRALATAERELEQLLVVEPRRRQGDRSAPTRTAILACIRQHGPICRADIVALLRGQVREVSIGSTLYKLAREGVIQPIHDGRVSRRYILATDEDHAEAAE